MRIDKMNVKTLVISAATVLVLGGGAFVATQHFGGESTGAGFGQKQPSVYRPFTEAKKDKQQIWYFAEGAAKDALIDQVWVVKDGKVVAYDTSSYGYSERELTFADFDKMSDAEVIERAKKQHKANYEHYYENYGLHLLEENISDSVNGFTVADYKATFEKYEAPEPRPLVTVLGTDDTGNNVSAQALGIKYDSSIDKYKHNLYGSGDIGNIEDLNTPGYTEEVLYGIAPVKTVLSHDYWGYATDEDYEEFMYLRVQSGEPIPTVEFDPVDTKGAKVK
jgi:hypothetical protein